MVINPDLLDASAADDICNVSEINAILIGNDDYILALARKKVPRQIASPEVLDLEIHELAQRARIKLWRTLRKRHVIYVKSYIRLIVRSESIDMVRSHKSYLPLPVDEDGELYQGNVLVTPSEGMQDPLYELLQKETAEEFIMQAVDLLCSFPHCQQQAMVCLLNEQVDDVTILTKAFRKFEINVVGWPREKKERTRLKASLSAAHKRMCSLKREPELAECG